MTSTRNPLQDFMLTPQQQNLLFAALNSNRPVNSSVNTAANLSPLAQQFNESPVQGSDGLGSLQDSPDFDYDYDFGGVDESFDFSFDDTSASQPKMIGDLPGAAAATTATTTSSKSDSPGNESSDKRSHPDDGEENAEPKRRESEDKVAKKPGRKPLTTEPSSKRKAQNRAAQRAFRERKEKHLKDLETKVQELEQASESANNENDKLRAQLDKLNTELTEYKKRLSMLTSANRGVNRNYAPFGAPVISNLNDVNFQFEFPKFGGPRPGVNNAAKASTASVSPAASRSNSDQLSPREQPKDKASPPKANVLGQTSKPLTQADLTHFFSTQFDNTTSSIGGNGTDAAAVSPDSHFSAVGMAASTSSPSASSNSMGGPSSSCGTSPEPSAHSPMGFKPVDTLATIGEEQPNFGATEQDFASFADADFGSFNWVPQNNFQFDPQLFGDYREPQENVLSQGFDDSFFNDALDMDFPTPFNLPVTTSSDVLKKDLIAQIDAAQNADDSNTVLTCNKIWEKLQGCPKVQSGDFDLDGLCQDLQKKAKCSGNGAVVNEKDFEVVMKKYLCKDGEPADFSKFKA